MEEKNKKGTGYITSEELDKKFDEKLGEQAKVIISAVDTIVNKRLAESESRLEKKIDDVRTSIDGYVKAQEDFKEEFVIVKAEGKQMKQVFKEKLGVEIRAF